MDLRECALTTRKLNQKLVKDKFPLPIIEDVLDTLQEAKVYSTLDLRNGFFHVDVDEDCRKYTSFIVPDGQFEFNKVPFGLSTSPGVFQRYV
ncbi:retrovirus-related Pol polyprotein from transposon 412 [Trichonephila clavipes]|nr:retrovirus-related Pol polyprotein from transposon 412 [Trichonephila clavipes]